MYIHPKFITLMVLLVTTRLAAQIPIQSNFQNVTPASPEVASIAKNVDIPMSYTSGTPQIGIPIYTLKSGSIEVPIALSYNASGIRVSEVASWVGLGWNLSTGRTLTRMIRSLPDEGPNGLMNAAPNRTIKYLNDLPYWPNDGWDERALIERENMAGIHDFEPDIFNFSALGYSGSFFWNQDSGKFILVPYQNIKLEYSWGSFTITLPNGIQCFFNCPCENMAWSTSVSVVNGESQAPSSNSSSNIYPSMWPITRIRDPLGKTIDFSYSMDYWVEDFGRGSETKGVSLTNESGAHIVTYSRQAFNKPILQSISADNAIMVFNRSAEQRQDVYNLSRSLASITITNRSNEELKTFEFNYYYTTSDDGISLHSLEQYYEVARKRLFLRSVTEKNVSQGVSLPPWEFSYDSMPLPNRLSNQQDYWGYYNGKTQPDHLLMPRIPKLFRMPLLPSTELPKGYIPGADRTISTRHAQAGILTQIKYPTGGITRYYYESNDAIVNMYYRDYGGIERPDINYRRKTFGATTVPIPVGGARYLSDTINVLTPQTQVLFDITLPAPCNNQYDDAGCEYVINIKSLHDASVSITRRQSGWVYYQLPRGWYRIEVLYSGAGMPNFTIAMGWGEVSDTVNFKIGGLRAYKIVSEDGTGNTVSRSFSYRWPGDSTAYSSGMLAGLPAHITNEYSGPGIISQVMRYQYVSNSATPLTTDGQTVRYQFVNEFYDSAKSSFKTEYTFLSDFPMISVGPSDNAPPLQKSWMNNMLLRKRSYEKIGGTFRPLVDEFNAYESFKELAWLACLHGIQVRHYQIASEWFLPVRKSTTMYSYRTGQPDFLHTETFSSYNNDFLLAKTSTINSKGQSIDTRVWYPNDFNNTAGANLALLKTNHIIGLPVKQENSVNGKLSSGNIVLYNPVGLPEQIYQYEKDSPQDTVPHDPSRLLTVDYKLKTAISYNEEANVKQVSSINEPVTAYIWQNDFTDPGSNLNFAVAAVTRNAGFQDVAFTSFESKSHEGWIYSGQGAADATAPTGMISYYINGTNPISKQGLSYQNTYTVSYWSKNGPYSVTGSRKVTTGRTMGAWTHYSHEVSGVGEVMVSGYGYIDELRLHPKSAEMTSFTHRYGIGITSRCDANNRISYFEYDSLGRLIAIRDQDRNVVKAADYKYQISPQD